MTTSIHEPTPPERAALLDLTGRLIEQHWEQVRDGAVTRDAEPAAVREQLARYDFEQPVDPARVVEHVAELLARWTVHTTSPRYFGLFNPTPTFMGVIGDALAAAFNPQLAVWSHAPAAVEIEDHLIRFVAGRLGYPPGGSAGSFTTGGAEANLTAVLAALTHAFPRYGDDGLRALPGQPVLYASEESHLAWLKIAHATGLGRRAVRLVPVDRELRLDVGELRRMVSADRAAGNLPFLVAATAGTTSAGIIDPLPAIQELCVSEGLWHHVDAAWAGAVALSTRLRGQLAGMESSDSVTVDAHKWLSVPMGAGMFLTRTPHAIGEAFRVATAYMPAGTSSATDPYTSTMQWSRRFIGLKLFLSLAVAGRSGYERELERHVELGHELRSLLQVAGWRVENPAAALPVVCTTHESWSGLGTARRAKLTAAVAAHVVDRGRVWISATSLAGRPAIRACVISFRTTTGDVRELVAELERARQALTAQPST